MSEVISQLKDIEKMRTFAESDNVGNQAFLGLKGIGKTSLFQNYFTREKRREIAQNYKKLFVFSQLDSRKSGTDLYQFLLDQVKVGILEIPNMDDKKAIREELPEIDSFFESPDGRLNQYLTLIKDVGYDLIIIMDHFHCMERDSDIGQEQYDVLRSLNEQKLITFWIITDTDLLDSCASKEFIASFFAQKFTSKYTIKPPAENEKICLINHFEAMKKVELSEDERASVCELSSGIPTLISVLIDIISISRNNDKSVSKEELKNQLIDAQGAKSLFANWIMGISQRKKEILFNIATQPEACIYEKDYADDLSKLADLSDEVGRGILHVSKEENGKVWCLTVPVMSQYIVDEMQKQDELVVSNGNMKNSETASEASTVPTVNNYYIQGDLIQSQTNNVVNIENAVAGLEDLQQLFGKNTLLLDENRATRTIESLPFKDDVWKEMDEEEQEKELDKYADGIFSSDIFTNGVLTPGQYENFKLSEEILDRLSDECRTQIVCGIQVYDLIQNCIDRFGLSMNESESPRGILFARAFERHMKDVIAPAFCSIPQFASETIMLGRNVVRFPDCSVDKTTIGTYTKILGANNKQAILADIATNKLGIKDKNASWWRQYVSVLKEIGNLRNQCCHSGSLFDNDKLLQLKQMIFDDEALADCLIFDDIAKLNSPVTLDLFLLNKTVDFRVLAKDKFGSFDGIVQGKYPATLPGSETRTLDFAAVKDTVIQAKIVSMQDGKYILSVR